MTVQFIYTFQHREQVITEYNDLWKAFLESKNVFLSWAMAVLDTDEERMDVVKISSCIATEKWEKIPENTGWYDEIRGKFWTDDLEKWRKENGFSSTVTKSYLREFGYLDPQL